MEIRRSYDRLISTMGFPILVRRHLYIESGPWSVTKVPYNSRMPCPREQRIHGLRSHRLQANISKEDRVLLRTIRRKSFLSASRIWVELIHWNENVVILTKFSSLAALEVVIFKPCSPLHINIQVEHICKHSIVKRISVIIDHAPLKLAASCVSLFIAIMKNTIVT